MTNAPITLRLVALASALAAAALMLVPLAGAATAPTKAQIAAGKLVFAKAGCGKCHTLTAAKATGTVGPNLNTHHYPLATIVNQVTSGGRFMPPFAASKGGSLSATQVKNVAAFVYAAEHAKK
jgi:mono/diheme cytochrome c family protein